MSRPHISEASVAPEPDFDRVARPYRWLEYLTFGPVLQQVRTCFLLQLNDRRHALLFGDGDGRFLARLLSENPSITADAVDTSATMLELLRRRAQPLRVAAPARTSRLRTHHQSALTFIPTDRPDLVVTHFFLDCLTQGQTDALIKQLTPFLHPEALWVISEFRVPPGLLHHPARIVIRALYLAFRLLTGLRTIHLPNYHRPLAEAGFTCRARQHRLAGLLAAELWQRQPPVLNHHEDATVRDLGYPHT